MKFIRQALLLYLVFLCPIIKGQGLDITFPSERAVFQRNNGNASIIYIAGNYKTKLDKIEAKLDAIQGGQSIGWTTIVDRPFFGNYRGSLVAAGGWYKLSVRGWYQGQVVAESTVNKFGIGEVFLISGQSNAQGYFGRGQRGAYDDRVNVVSNFISESGNQPPYPSFGHLDAESPIAPTGKGAWYWGELGDMLAAQLNVPILFMNAAWEGFQVSQFAKSSDGAPGVNPYSYNQAPPGYPFGSIADALHFYTNLTGIRAILWHQGESDNYLSTGFNQYANDLLKVINDTKGKTGKDISWVVARVSKDANRTFQPIIDAQNFVINNHGNVFAGPNTDNIFDRTDGVHFSTSGFSKVANAWAQSLNQDFFQRSTPQFGNPPLQIQPFCGLEDKSKPMLLSAPQGYVSYNWNTGSKERTLQIGPGFYQGLAKDIFGNVYYSAPIAYDNSLIPTKPTLTASGPTEFCAGQSVELITNNDFQNYWSNGAEGKKITVQNAGEYFVTHVNIYSCNASSNSVKVTNFPTPQPQIIASGPLEICSDQSLTLSTNLDNGIIWSTGDQTKDIVINTSGFYSLKGKNEFGCEGQSETVEVKIKPAAIQPIAVNLGEDVFCQKDSTILRVTNLQNMKWSTGASTSELIVSTTGEYFALNTNEFGCTAKSKTFNILVNPIPKKPSIIIEGDIEVCDDEIVKLKASSAYRYHWNTGHTEEEIEVKASKEVFLKTSNEFGCFSDASDPVGVVILEKPKNPNILQTGTFTLSSVFSTDTSDIDYQWQVNDQALDKNAHFIKARVSGDYTVRGLRTYQLQNGNSKTCTSELSEPYQYYIDPNSKGFSIYPNPIEDGIVHIETLEDVDNATVTIYGLDGRPFFTDYVDVFNEPKTFDIHKIPTGKYIIKVRNNRSRFYKKIMIEQP